MIGSSESVLVVLYQKTFNDILGADQETRHAPADLTNLEDIEDDEPVNDVITVGLQNLVEGNKNPLSNYNEAFRNLQV